MAFGPQTQLFQTALRMLMQGREPSPLAPVPVGPLTRPDRLFPPPPGPPPEPAPVAPLPALDQSLIEQLTGPRPVAPAPQPDPLILKIARALQGFGAGVQGQGPQFLAGLREERERPQREFRAATEAYEQRRRGAIGIAEEKRQREQAGIQRRADIQSEREFQLYELEKRDRMQEARDLRQQAAALEREEVKLRAEKLKQDQKDAKDRETAIINLANSLFDDLRISRQEARRFAEYEIAGKPLSAADAKKYNRMEKYRRPEGGTGGASTGPVMAQLENGAVVPLTAVNRDTGRVILDGKPLRVVGYVGGRIPAQPRDSRSVFQQQQPAPSQPTSMFSFPEFSGGLMTGAPQQTQTATEAQLRQYAQENGITPDEAREDFRKARVQIVR